jgi:hypothetical protein
MKSINVKITGIRPLVMHNGLLADPTNPFVVAIKRITSKGAKKMTEADYEERDRQEWLGGLYWSEAVGGPYIPPDNIERCIMDGARKSRLGKDVAAAVFVSEPEVPIVQTLLRGKTKEALFDDEAQRFTLRRGVKMATGSRIIRIRPLIPTGWTASFTVEFDETIINERNLHQAIIDAGSYCGIGDWRPKFGRFTVEVIS